MTTQIDPRLLEMIQANQQQAQPEPRDCFEWFRQPVTLKRSDWLCVFCFGACAALILNAGVVVVQKMNQSDKVSFHTLSQQ